MRKEAAEKLVRPAVDEELRNEAAEKLVKAVDEEKAVVETDD